MNCRLIVAAAALTAALSATAAQAQDNWVLMGSKDISLSKSAESIDLGAAKGNFKAIRLTAKRRNIEIENVEVVYSNGPAHNERRPINLLEGERTRPIDQQSESRFVDRVNLTYKAKPSEASPTVLEIYGLQSSAGARAQRSGDAKVASAAPTAAAGNVAAVAAANVPARPGVVTDTGEVLFGAQAVGFAVDRDVIRVGAEVGKFKRVRLRILDNEIFINSIKVVFANGESQEFAYNADAKKDTRTNWFDLKGDRFIKEVQLIYRAKPNFRGQAYIEVYGQFADGWLGPQGEGKNYNSGFVLLGAQTAGFTIDRNDVIKISQNEGGFKKIEVRVRDQAITLFEVRVLYGNGEIDVIPANRTKVDAGGRFGPLDLKGGTRVIQEIRPTYRTRIFQAGGVARGRAVVEFWGQH